MTLSILKERNDSHLIDRSLCRGPLHKASLQHRLLCKIIILSWVFLPAAWISVAPAYAVDASGTATIRCGAFTGDPQNDPAWVSSVPYSISDDQISLGMNPRSESNQWSGTVDHAGHIVLTGAGSGGDGAWVMHFTGKWHGTGDTRLAGGYRNVRGMVGHRTCSILF